MKTIYAKDHAVLVDDSDFESLSDFNWSIQTNASGVRYAITYGFAGRKTYMHRMILRLADSSIHVDHIDGNGLNNCRENLRACSHAENMQNRRLHKPNKSGIRGVYYNKRSKKQWLAQVYFHGEKHRKLFSTAQEAGAWARAKRAELYGATAHVD